MNCPYCNSQVPDGAQCCPVCDQPLSASTATAGKSFPGTTYAPGSAAPKPPDCGEWVEKNSTKLRVYLLAGVTVMLLLLFICSVWPVRYEYKTVAVKPSSQGNDFQANEFTLESALNDNRDWELVSTVPEIESVHPNFGRQDLVPGIKSNTRTRRIILVFRKRKLF